MWLSRYTTVMPLLDLHGQYFSMLRVLVDIFVVAFHLSITVLSGKGVIAMQDTFSLLVMLVEQARAT